MFSINSLNWANIRDISQFNGFSIITCHVRQGYNLPTEIRFTNLGNIPSSIEVSMYLKSAFNAVERIAFPIAPVNMPAVRTFLAGISGVYGYNRFAISFGFIPEKLLKLIETPVIKFSGELNSLSSALYSYAVQILNSKQIERHSHNLLRDIVINPGYKPFFFSANLAKKSFSGTSAFALEFRSKICVLCPHVFDWFAVEKHIIGSYCNINYPSINPKNIVSFNRCRRLLSDSYMQIKNILLPVIFNRGCSQFPIKILPVIFDIANPLIIPDSREGLIFRKFLKFNTFKSFTGNISDSLQDRAGKFRILFTNIILSSMVNRYFAACAVLKTVPGNLIKYLIAKNHSLSEGFFAFLRQFQFKFNRSIHIHILQLINVNNQWYWGGGVRFLLEIDSEVSTTPVPRRT